MNLSNSRLLILIIVWGCSLISTSYSETVQLRSPDDILKYSDVINEFSSDAENSAGKHSRPERLIFNIYRDYNPNSVSGQSGTAASSSSSLLGGTGSNSGTSRPFAGFPVTVGFISPELRESLRSLTGNLRQRARTLFQTARALVGSTTSLSGSSLSTTGNRNSIINGLTDTSSNPTSTGFSSTGTGLTNLRFSPETRETLRTLGTTLGQTFGRFFRIAQNSATRLAARYRPTTENSLLSVAESEKLNENF